MNNNNTTPHHPPWAVRAWPPLLWQLGRNDSLPLQHHATQINPSDDPAFRSMGQTLWTADCSSGQAAMAWDWVELAEGLYALADPLGIVTNLRLVNGSGEILPALESARHINGIVHGLPWQQAVEQAAAHPPQRAAASSWFVPRSQAARPLARAASGR